MQDDGRLVLTVTEAARALAISRALAYELVARGELPPCRWGGAGSFPAAPLKRSSTAPRRQR